MAKAETRSSCTSGGAVARSASPTGRALGRGRRTHKELAGARGSGATHAIVEQQKSFLVARAPLGQLAGPQPPQKSKKALALTGKSKSRSTCWLPMKNTGHGNGACPYGERMARTDLMSLFEISRRRRKAAKRCLARYAGTSCEALQRVTLLTVTA